MRIGLRTLIHHPPVFTVTGEAGDGNAAIRAMELGAVDVVLMDLQMPGINGVHATAEITRRWPSVRVLVMTAFAALDAIVPALRAGASGYLLKGATRAELLQAIRGVATGTTVLEPRVAGLLVSSLQRSPRPRPDTLGSEVLTPREAEAVAHLAQGMSNAEIARAINISEATVKSHLGSVARKWSVRDRTQILIRAAEIGMIHLG
ncbi:response regulator transcription factor [Microbacterium horticulturae]|uniref:Response regulator transcription factor n=1 Tax=Microbacterium horticulturae TaxID=3028316 RepID=A0ABY8C2N0_9MICO|nr:response regulator transcription factor [Microbacterium sp. KACC 23027]WEG10734.1 response regulator transcription factor [Microbacterium sp. KACC 23027]